VLTGHGCINIVKGQKEGAVRKTIAILGSAIFFAVAPGVCIVSLRAWEALDAELKAIVAHACAAEASFALAEMERLNAEALAALIERHNVTLRVFPRDVVDAARKVAADVLGEVAARSELARKVHDSYAAFRERTGPWSRVSIKAVLEAREG
jgi:TRAP-type mannitol/chloroaromatic compound transport system substrate-binding protein